MAWRRRCNRCCGRTRSAARSSCFARSGQTPRHSAYRLQFVVVAYQWHPLCGQRVRLYGRQGRAGRQILYIEVRPGLSREIPEGMCDAAACAAITSGNAQVAIDGLIELRAVLDSRTAELASARSSTSCTVKEGPDETSLWQPTDARPRLPPRAASGGTGAGRAAERACRPAARSSRQSKQQMRAECEACDAFQDHL